MLLENRNLFGGGGEYKKNGSPGIKEHYRYIVSVAAYSERTQTTNLHITSKVTGKVTSCFTRENFVKQAYENERAVVVD